MAVAFRTGVALAAPATSGAHIVLTNDGFQPKVLQIPVGSSVTFTTTRGRYFWPASDEHPSHSIYPEFDPRAPISPEDSWSHTFERPGVWKFHDHVSPSYTGEIRVMETGDRVVPIENKENVIVKQSILLKLNNWIVQNVLPLNYRRCMDEELNHGSRIQCWEHVVVKITQRKGLITALNFVHRQRSRDTAFASDCHVYVHRIGEEYYWKFFNDRKIEVSDKFGLCDQGFFHGFMQEFTSHGTNMVQAKRYCDTLLSRMKQDEHGEMLIQQCYHGIGHGAAFLYAASLWGNTDEIIRRSIADCRSLIDGNPRMCISGVFGGIAAMHWGLHGFTLEMDPSNPWELCKNQVKPENLECYDQLVPVLFSKVDLDLEAAGRLVAQISDAEIQRVAMIHLGSMPSYTIVSKTEDYSQIVQSCRRFASPLDRDCLYGFSGAITRIGALPEAQARSIRFCESSYLTEAERAVCYDSVRQQISIHYSEREAVRFCERISARYQHSYCSNQP